MDIKTLLSSPGPDNGFDSFTPGPWSAALGETRAWQLALHLGDDPIWATWAWSSTGGSRVDRLLLVSAAVVVLVEPWSITSCAHRALRRMRTREQELLLDFEPPLSKEGTLALAINDWHAAPLLDLLDGLYRARRQAENRDA